MVVLWCKLIFCNSAGTGNSGAQGSGSDPLLLLNCCCFTGSFSDLCKKLKDQNPKNIKKSDRDPLPPMLHKELLRMV